MEKNNNDMLYGVSDNPPMGKRILFSIQMVLSVFVASVLIAQICGVSTSGALFGAGAATIAYLVITKFESPMFLSNSGAFVAPVIAALAAGGYTAVLAGGAVSCLIYCLFGFIFSKVPVDSIYKVFPRSLIGAVTVCIGVGLMEFIPSYVQIAGEINMWGVSVALVTMVSIALISHYAKGIMRVLPFLIGILIGYVYATILTVSGVFKVIDFSVFSNMTLFSIPDLAMFHIEPVKWGAIIPIVVIYIAYTISAMMECLSDHAALGNIIGVDLYRRPGLGRIFCGTGIANIIGSIFGGLGICSYGEGVACVGFSRVAAVSVTGGAASIMLLLSCLTPIQVFIASIPSCAFAGAAILLYAFIACSGVRMLQTVDLNNQKNLLVVSATLSLGICGLIVGGNLISFSGTALALIVGFVLNLLLKEK